jgi:hypothetical protein
MPGSEVVVVAGGTEVVDAVADPDAPMEVVPTLPPDEPTF